MISNSAIIAKKDGEMPNFKEIALKAGYNITEYDISRYIMDHPIAIDAYSDPCVTNTNLNKLFIYWVEQCTTHKKLDSSQFIRVNTSKHRWTLLNWRDKLVSWLHSFKLNKQP